MRCDMVWDLIIKRNLGYVNQAWSDLVEVERWTPSPPPLPKGPKNSRPKVSGWSRNGFGWAETPSPRSAVGHENGYTLLMHPLLCPPFSTRLRRWTPDY